MIYALSACVVEILNATACVKSTLVKIRALASVYSGMRGDFKVRENRMKRAARALCGRKLLKCIQ